MSKIFSITEGLENMGALRTGGQGSVYKGRRTGTIITAVKILPTPIHSESPDDKNYRNFLNEVEKLKKVNETPNPNVVKILNSGITESGSLPFIEMDFIEGPDLEELLKPPHNAIFKIKEVIKLADQLAGALAHCHKVGVMHGDIKSNNVKFNIHSGNYVLLDFGLSVISEEERRSSMRHAGAIEFMAPEQNEGRILFQTDVYSYGVILYELLAGQVPFPLKNNGETSRNQVMIAHMEMPVPDLLELRNEHIQQEWTADEQRLEMQVPPWLLKIISKCLEKLPENRYSNGAELQEAIVTESLSASYDTPLSFGDVAVLKRENEKLKARLLQYGEQPENGKTSPVNISRPAFAALIVLLMAAVSYAGYGLLSKKSTQITTRDTIVKFVPVVLKKPRDSVQTARAIMPDLSTKVDSTLRINFPDSDTLKKTKKKAHKPMVAKKKRRKKFLGIF